MYAVKTDHQIVGINPDLMHLLDETGALIAAAERVDGSWTITAEDVPDVTAASRGEAITALTEQALKALGGTGYSTMVPHGLSAAP